MIVTILAPGSRGDVQPYVALGAGLRRAGHAVRFVTTRDFEGLAREHGLDVWPMEMNVEAAVRSARARAAIEGGGLVASFRELTRVAREGARELFTVADRASDGADLVLAGFGAVLAGASVAEARAVRFVQAFNVPLTPTRAFPGALFPWLSFAPRALTHRLGHHLTRQAVWLAARSAGNAARREVFGLGPAPRLAPFDRGVYASGPVLYGLGPSVLPHPSDWPERAAMTGFWFLDEPSGWVPDPALAAFLAAGPPPVYVGFGSMSSERPEETAHAVLEAVARTGRRALVHAGWAGLGETGAADGVHVIGSVPHAWLFPRVAAVVHHGGAGTTAAVLRAGVPAVVVPFHGDQAFWGRLVHELGVAAAPLPRSRLTGPRLASALGLALGDAAVADRARALAERVRAEDGVGSAVALLEGEVRGSTRALRAPRSNVPRS